MDDFARFNELFPKSSYRLIKPGTKMPDGIQKYTYESMYVAPSQRVGWIISEGYIVVDCDDMTVAKIIQRYITDSGIKCCYFKSVRGMHFIFRMPKNVTLAKTFANAAHIVTTSTLEVDYRVQGAGYIILPLHDDSREWTHFSDETDEVPCALYPMFLNGASRTRHDEMPDLYGLGDGDGRNDALFRWIKQVRTKYSDPEVLSEIGYMINQYIFAQPISRNELNKTVLRESNLTYASDPIKKKTMAEQELDVAIKMMNENKYYTDEKRLYVFNGKYYEALNDRDIERSISSVYAPAFRMNSRSEVFQHLLTKSPMVCREMEDAWNLISFNNCVLNVETGEQHPHSSSLYASTHVNHDYVCNAPPTELIETFLNMCANGDVQKRQIILEMIGDCFLKRALFQKMYLIYGEGGTGKSTLLRLITECVGEENATFLSMHDLESTFYPWELVGKLVNIGDDIPFGRINDSSVIKKLVSGERMMVQRKFGHPSSFANYATMIFTTNKLPQTNDRTSGFMRRLVLIDMNTRIQNPITFFMKNIGKQDIEYLIYIALDAISLAIRRGELSHSFVVDNNLQAYQRMQSALSEYIDDENITRDSIIGRDVASVYADYTLYCQINGMRPIGKHNLVSELCALLFITTASLPDANGRNQLRFTYVDNNTTK